MVRSMKRRFAFALKIFLAMMFTFVLLEGMARFYLAHAAPRTEYEFRSRQPPPYRDAPYFTPQFLKEQYEQGSVLSADMWMVTPKDYRGTYYNVVGGIRSTADQPERYDRTLYIFGGSTMFNGEVPDGYTIASYLQADFAGQRLRVVNMGVKSLMAQHELARLKTVALRPDDIVVFYDGVNEVAESLFYNNPQGSMAQSMHNMYAGLQGFARLRYDIWRRYGSLAMVDLGFYPYSSHWDLSHLDNPAHYEALLDQMQQGYYASLIEAYHYAKAAGADFWHFLQPQIYSAPPVDAYEQSLLGQSVPIFARGWPVLQQVQARLEAEGIPGADLTHAVDDLRKRTPIYLDYCHMNHVGNEAVAREIYNQLSVF